MSNPQAKAGRPRNPALDRAILAAALDVPDRAIFRLGVPHASVSVLEWTGDEPVVAGLDVLGGLRP